MKKTGRSRRIEVILRFHSQLRPDSVLFKLRLCEENKISFVLFLSVRPLLFLLKCKNSQQDFPEEEKVKSSLVKIEEEMTDVRSGNR